MSTDQDWPKPAMMAIPKEGYFEEQRGRYGPIFPRTPFENHVPSFVTYGEYPYVTSDEIKNALRLNDAFSDMLDQMQ